MEIVKAFEKESVDKIADNLFNAVSNSVSEVKAMQQRKAAENVQLVIQALKKIENNLQDKYDGVTTVIEKRVAAIKDGRDGVDGRNGKDGKDGRSGRDGAMGPRGPAGRDGTDGRDGEDGVSVTDARIDFDGSLIISLSTGREINVGEVVAPDLAERIKVITNGGGTSQSVLDTLTSLQAQITALQNLGAVNYVGTWNASTNTPTIVNGTGDKGDYYVVSVAGSTNIDGQTLWGVGDWIIFNGTVWQRVDGGSTGNFTDLSASGTVTFSGELANSVTYLNGSKELTTDGTLTYTGKDLAIARPISPTWGGFYNAFQIGDVSLANYDYAGSAILAMNAIWDGSGSAKYVNSYFASYYQQYLGEHEWYIAPSGTAGNTISFVQAMTLSSNGNLGIGVTNPTSKLDVNGTAKISGAVTLSGGDLSFGGNAARAILMARHTTANTAGNDLTVQSGGATSGATDKNGGTLALSSGTATGSGSSLITFSTSTAGAAGAADRAPSEKMRLDGAGNLGLGVTPSAWASGWRALQTLGGNSFYSDSTVSALASNAIYDGAWKYVATAGAGTYQINRNAHNWFIAPSGTAGNTISFTQAMTLDASGNLLVGRTSRYGSERVSVLGGVSDALMWLRNTTSAQPAIGVLAFDNNQAGFIGAQVDSAYGLYLQGASHLSFRTASTERARIDSSGNLGLGVTPSAWRSGDRVLDIGSTASLVDAQSANTRLYNNTFVATGGINTYKITAAASYYDQGGGLHRWFNAPSGTAGNAITFTQAMTLDGAGNLGIGTSSPLTKIHAMSSASSVTFSLSPNSSNTNIAYLTNDATYISLGSSVGSTGVKFRVALGAPDNAATIDASGNLQMRAGAVVVYQPAPAAINTTATLTNANIQAQIINTTGTSYTVTMPLGTTLETLVTWATTDLAYDFTVINTASGTITMAVNTGVTSLGALTIATNESAQFRIRRTAANTFVLYRLS